MSQESTLKAKEYYDSEDANLFYMKIWGGENLHIGFYDDDTWSLDTVTPEEVRTASVEIVDVMINDCPNFSTIKRVADLGAGIGGTARRICEKNKDVVVDCYEISEKENNTNNELNKKAGYSDRINVIPKSYTETGSENEKYDLIVSQDAFLHCDARDALIAEVERILKPGGYFIFTDPMQSNSMNKRDSCQPERIEALKPIYDRLGLPDLCSPGVYSNLCRKKDLAFVQFHDLSYQMKRHYSSVKRILDDKGSEVGISDEYIKKASTGLSHWVNGVEAKNLTWGILLYQKLTSEQSEFRKTHNKTKYRGALVTAASRLSSLDSHGTPKCLIDVGGTPLIHHVLQQLHSAGIDKIVVTLGFQGAKIREFIERVIAEEDSVLKNLRCYFVDVDEQIWSTRGHAVSCLQAAPYFSSDFIICTADHIFEPHLVENLLNSDLDENEGIILVETDLEGMVGLPASTNRVFLGDNNKVKTLGAIAENPDAPFSIDCGLFLVGAKWFDYLEQLNNERPYFTVSNSFALMAEADKLLYQSTEGLTWFSIETTESLQFALDKHNDMNEGEWFRVQSEEHAPAAETLQAFKIAGHSSVRQKTPHSGGEWSEFSVERWRSAVFTTGSYFSKLYKATGDFARKALKECAIDGKSTLIEVGCGTGEFLNTVVDSADYVIGVDINEDFINWCQKSVNTDRGNVTLIHGDASDLENLLKTKAPAESLKYPKVIACVGNTFGIMPQEIKEKVLRKMGETAGPEGRVMIVYWDSEWFPDAIKNFYGKNPQLCGPFTEKDVSWETTTLETPSGYVTHWTGAKEASEIIAGFGFKEIRIENEAKGTLVLSYGV